MPSAVGWDRGSEMFGRHIARLNYTFLKKELWITLKTINLLKHFHYLIWK
jgi:hypothetical protein